MSPSKPQPATDAYGDHVFARLLDFFGRSTRWQRRLWSVGTSVLLREGLEASRAVRDGVLSPDALKFLLDETRRATGPDPGVGVAKTSLSSILASELTYDGAEFRRLREVVPQCERKYVGRWAEALRDSSKRPKAERAARAIAGHLLGAGFSADYLHRWFTYRFRYAARVPMSDVLVEADEKLAEATASPHIVLVVFRTEPSQAPLGTPPWLTAPEASAWLTERSHDVTGLRQHGGVLLKINALDPWAAVEAAADRADAIATRARLGTRGGTISVAPHAWVDGEKKVFSLRESRRVEIRALEREHRLFDLEGAPGLDAALHLLAPLDEGPAGSAVAGGWAAIESALSMPGDRGGKIAAADRTADLVATSWPRAELTALAHRFVANDATGTLVEKLRAAETNRDRCAVLADAIQQKESLAFSDPSDAAALERMKDVLASPATRLDDVRAHVVAAVRRLYRQRNLVLHGDQVESIALRPALRAAAPLVGAAFDRIAHARLVDGVDARDLASRARLRLEQCGSGSTDVVDLLEPAG